MKGILENNYYEEDLYVEEYSFEDIEKLEAVGAFDFQNCALQLALDELEELRGDDIIL